VTAYRCRNERRLAAVRDHATLNGIDFLEVLDHDAPAGVEPQRTLIVRFVKPIPALTEDNVRLHGGERVPVHVVWAARADAVASPPATPEDAALAGGIAQGDRVLVVRTDSAGDYSTYRLALATSAADDAPPRSLGFDPVLSEVAFSFKVECESAFDCGGDRTCPVHGSPPPLIDYLAKDYEGFRRLMLDRITTLLPEWSDRNPADLGVTMVEMLAAVADRISYAQDAIATESTLQTARDRVSVRRHARLLDYRLGEGCNARAWVCFEVGAAAPPVLAAGTTILPASADDVRVQIRPQDLDEVLAAGRPVVFETMRPVRLAPAHNRIEFHPWSDADCCLPAGATSATLVVEPGFALAPGDFVLFEEEISPVTGTAGDADPTRRHVVRLSSVEVTTDPLDATPVAEIAWPARDALPFPLCVTASVPVDGGREVRPVCVARGNVALADHGRTVVEPLVPAQAPVSGVYRPRLARSPVASTSPLDRSSATAASETDARAALPAASIRGDDGTLWRPAADLMSSGRFTPEFVVDPGGDGRAAIRFGDGLNGRAPTPGATFTATYRIGNGSAGNVGAETLGRVVLGGGGITGVRNPLPARGGTDPESIERARIRAPVAFRRPERAVTAADYAAIAERSPEVQRAGARIRWTGSWHTAFVTVDRAGGGGVDHAFAGRMAANLEPYRMAGRDVRVVNAVAVALDIELLVCVDDSVVAADVQRRLLDELGSGPLPGGRLGMFHPDNLTLGRPVYLSAIVETAMREPGVVWARAIRFERFGSDVDERGAGVIAAAPLEILRCDNDPSFPERGVLAIRMQGGA